MAIPGIGSWLSATKEIEQRVSCFVKIYTHTYLFTVIFVLLLHFMCKFCENLLWIKSVSFH